MTLKRERFTEFFSAAYGDGRKPFPWQERLLDHILSNGRWPDQIIAPTGAGKSSVVDAHVFAVALMIAGAGPRVPRRMAVAVNRRSLVDQHDVHARDLASKLANATDGVLSEIHQLLSQDAGDRHGLHAVSLRGGLPNDRTWLDNPKRCAVIAVTPDMWGSRILFRGYGSNRLAWPREAGFLAYDSVVVLDEAHLNRQLLRTAQEISRITESHSTSLGDVPALQAVAMTATPEESPDADSVGVNLDDLCDTDSPLTQRLTRPKWVTYHASKRAPIKGKASAAYIDELADLATSLREEAMESHPGPATVACVVNNVDTAITLARELRRRHDGPEDERAVECWVGRMRPLDLEQLRKDRPDLFTPLGDSRVHFLVATQTIEVGVNLDFAGLVTEVAPGSALGQRFGRVNRRGLRSSAEIVVVGPPADIEALDRPPYRAADLEAARAWLPQGVDRLDCSPWRLTQDGPPHEGMRRLAYSTIDQATVARLAYTSSPRFAEYDLRFWLRDDLEDETEPAGIVVRDPLPEDDESALALLRATPVSAEEVFPASVQLVRELALRELLADEPSRIFLWRDGDISRCSLRPSRVDPSKQVLDGGVEPGDTLVVPASVRFPLEGVAVGDGPDTVSVTRWGPEDTYVVQALPTTHVEWPGLAAAQVSPTMLLDELQGMSPDDARDWIRTHYPTDGDFEVSLSPSDNDRPEWLVVTSLTSKAADPEARQEWSRKRQRVTLEQHQTAVRDRAEAYARGVGLPDSVVESISRAGRHHDEGKIDRRFQRGALLNTDDDLVLAKSGGHTAQELAKRRRSTGLPQGWRHEQLSVAWLFAHGISDPLVARLVGTSHGRGRPFFPHNARSLIEDDAGAGHGLPDEVVNAALNVFASGADWDDVLTTTTATFGPWGCAYLEAVLRAADGSVSAEGS